MAVKDEIKWFKQQFAGDVIPQLAGTPISFDLICAIAFQETGEIWSQLRRTQPVSEVLRLSVGDTLDTPNRSAFPRDKAALIAAPRGQEMFDLAHALLVEMGDATGIAIYQSLGTKPHKFVHGYGLFQYDLQFFQTDPDFFLEQRWKNIKDCVDKMMGELNGAVARLGLAGKDSLTNLESAFVAIIYNTGFGNFDANKGLEQGHNDGAHFYGENIDRYLQIAQTIPTPSAAGPGPAPLRLAGVEARRSVMDIAREEFDRFAGIDEGSQPLRSRIADYYEAGGGSRTLDPTKDENAWSAAFVSFCIKQAGATKDQFSFNLSHSVFVRDAIGNADAGRGVFRGHPVTDYAPQLGDLVHHNRSGGSLDFAFARANTGYPSHSAIVIDFEVRSGVRHAVTVGGNEFMSGGSGTVGQKSFALDSNGLLDQSKIGPKLISVIENRLAARAPQAEMALGPYLVDGRNDLNLRGGPGVEFPVLQVLAAGTPLTVLEFDDTASGRWALVDLEGDHLKDGYVFAKFLLPVTS